MKPETPNTDELLSAAHDGELGPEERATVDALLESSPAAREVLDDYRELSQLLQSLPRYSVPGSFTENVVRQLKPLSQPAAAAVEDSGQPVLLSPAAAARGRPVMLRAGALVAAASILVMLCFIGLRTRQPDALTQVASSAPEMSTALGIRRGVSPAAGPQGDESLSFSRSSVPVRLSVHREQLEQNDTGAQANRLAYLHLVGDETVIVELDVPNVANTAEEMVDLLRSRGVHVLGESSAVPPRAEPLDAAAPPSSTSGEQMVAVYVEASDVELAGMFDDLITQVEVADLAVSNGLVVQPPLAERLLPFDVQQNSLAREPAGEPSRSRTMTKSQSLTQSRLQELQQRTAGNRGRPSTERRSPIRGGQAPLADRVAPAAAPALPALAGTTVGNSVSEAGEAFRVALPNAVFRELEGRAVRNQVMEQSRFGLQSMPRQPVESALKPAAPASPPSPSPFGFSPRSEAVPDRQSLESEGIAVPVAPAPRRVLFVLQPVRP